MKKKFETSDIEQYFQVTNTIAPIISEEKVHQIINSPAAKARLKGKPRNFLKFTLMTTLFAVIISAILFWPGDEDKSQIPIDQIPNRIEAIGAKNAEIQVSEISEAGKKANADFQQSLQPTNDEMKADIQGSGNPSSQLNAEGNSFVSLVGDEKRKVNEGEKVNFDSIQPIDGSQFIIRADKALLEKLGFQFKGTGIYYQNYTTESGYVQYNYSSFQGYYFSLGFNYFFDTIPCTKNDFYLQMVTNISGEVKDYRTNYPSFEMANDTLLPVIVPVGLINNGELNDIILWFRITNNLLRIINLTSDSKEKIENAILFKRGHPDLNIVDYQFRTILSRTKFIELNAKELKPLGLYKERNSYMLRYRKNKSTIGERFITGFIEQAIENNYQDSINYQYIPVVTDTLGIIQLVEGDFDFEYLVPVLARKEIWGDGSTPIDLVLWFEPTLSFFNALPKEIGDKLKAEYNYITAEDKSTLEKPECKYFDECKNTLKVSSFMVYPNPTSANATVSFTLPEAITGRITLVDLSGRERQVLKPQTNYAKGSHSIEVDVSSVPEGIYLITLYSNKGVQTQRLIVNK